MIEPHIEPELDERQHCWTISFISHKKKPNGKYIVTVQDTGRRNPALHEMNGIRAHNTTAELPIPIIHVLRLKNYST